MSHVSAKPGSRGFLFHTGGTLKAFSIFAGIMGFALLLFTAASARERDSATQAVRTTVDEVMQILSDEQLKQPERVQERREFVQRIINQRVDYEEMGKRTLGLHWRTLSESDKKEFVSLFRTFLSNSYEDRFDEYSGEQVRYLAEHRQGDFAEVRTKLASHKVIVPLDFRLVWKSGQWWVYDLVVDGISLVRNYRAQFTRIIQSSSYQGLLEKLKTKTDLAGDIVMAR